MIICKQRSIPFYIDFFHTAGSSRPQPRHSFCQQSPYSASSSMPCQKRPHHRFPPVRLFSTVVLAGIFVLYQDSFPVTQTAVVIQTGFACFICHCLIPPLSNRLCLFARQPPSPGNICKQSSWYSTAQRGPWGRRCRQALSRQCSLHIPRRCVLWCSLRRYGTSRMRLSLFYPCCPPCLFNILHTPLYLFCWNPKSHGYFLRCAPAFLYQVRRYMDVPFFSLSYIPVSRGRVICYAAPAVVKSTVRTRCSMAVSFQLFCPFLFLLFSH